MFSLLAASLLWAFSFGLIKGELAGLDPLLVSLARLSLAALAFGFFVVNNLKVPLAVLVSWLVFGEEADYLRAGLGLIAVVIALFMAGAPRRCSTRPRIGRLGD